VLLKFLKWEYILFIPLFLFCFFFAELIVSFLGKSEPELFRLVAFVILLIPLRESLTAFFQGFKSFGKVLKGLLLESLLNLSLAFLFVVLFGLGMFGVVYAKILSLLGFILLSAFYFRKLPLKKRALDKKEIKKFAFGIVPSNLLRRGATLVKLVYMGLFILDIELGFYYLLSKITAYIISAPKDSLTTVLTPYNVERYKDKKTIGNFTSLTLKFSVLLTLVIGAIVVLIGQPLLSVFFPDFSKAFYLVPFFILHYTVKSGMVVSSVFSSLNRTDILAITNAAALSIVVIGGWILMPMYGVTGLLLTEIIQVIAMVAIMVYFSRRLGVPISVIPMPKDIKYFYSKIKTLRVSK